MKLRNSSWNSRSISSVWSVFVRRVSRRTRLSPLRYKAGPQPRFPEKGAVAPTHGEGVWWGSESGNRISGAKFVIVSLFCLVFDIWPQNGRRTTDWWRWQPMRIRPLRRTSNKRWGMPATCSPALRSDYVSINHISHLICWTYALHGGSSRVRSGCCRRRPTGAASRLRRSAAPLPAGPSSGRTCTVLGGSRRKAGRTSRPVRRCSRRPTNTRGLRWASTSPSGSRNDQNSYLLRGRWQRPPAQSSTQSMTLPHAHIDRQSIVTRFTDSVYYDPQRFRRPINHDRVQIHCIL